MEFHTSTSSTHGRLLGKISNDYLEKCNAIKFSKRQRVHVPHKSWIYLTNARPLNQRVCWPCGPWTLTPNHFLREGFKISIKDNLCKSQVARMRALLDSFWKRWIHEYLPCLTKRCKWCAKVKPPKIGDLFTIDDKNCPGNTWPLCKIKETYLVRDGQIRVVDVETLHEAYIEDLWQKIATLSSEGIRWSWFICKVMYIVLKHTLRNFIFIKC